MNKSFLRLFLFLAIFLSIVCVSGLPSVQLESKSYQPHETLIGVIDGTSSSLSKADIKFFQERRELTVNKEIYKFENKYYFYIILPTEGKYRLEINNLAYLENNSIGKIDFASDILIKSESLAENNTEIISISPGVVNSKSSNASLYVTNSGTKNVSLEYLDQKKEIYPGEITKINIALNKSFDLLTIKSYKEFDIPLIYLGAIVDQNTSNQTSSILNETNENLSKINLTSTIDFFKSTALAGRNEEYNFTIINLGDSLENITLLTDEKLVRLNLTQIDSLENRSWLLVFFSGTFDDPGIVEDTIRFFFNGSEILSIPVEIIVFDNESLSQQYQNNESAQQKSCEDFGGNICKTDENCDSSYVYSGGLCCLGACTQVEDSETSLFNVIAGMIIFLAVIGGVYYFYKTIKNVKKQTPEEKIKQIEAKKN